MDLIFDFFWTLLFLAAAMVLPKYIVYQFSPADRRNLQWLAVYHFVFGIVFYFFTRNGGGDAWTYWTAAKEMAPKDFRNFIFTGEGTRFMEAFNYIPANFFGMSFFANTMLYSLLGFVGISCFYSIAKELIPYNKLFFGFIMFPLVFFLPNLHFWSAGVGKDTVLFMCIGIFAYGLLKPQKRMPFVLLSLFLSAAIRPHIALFLLVSFGFAYIFGGKTTVFQRAVFSVFLLGAGLALLPVVTKFIGVEELSTAAVTKKAEIQVGNLKQGSGSAVDVTGYPLPLKVVTFLYRPLFFDAHSIGSLLSSVDNIFLLILSFLALKFRMVETFRKAPFIIKGFLFFGILGTLAFSTSLGNLGVMVRMKNMFTPGILIYFMWCYSYRLYLERVVPAQLEKISRKLQKNSLKNPEIVNS